jgi:inner membrane protein involved in colicin E2 resistance
MHPILRVFLLIVLLAGTSIAWLILGGTMTERTSRAQRDLYGQVSDLWGSEQTQRAPELIFHWTTRREEITKETVDGETREIRKWINVPHQEAVSADSTRAEVSLTLDPRRKGLLWYALYDVSFDGAWTYTHALPQAGWLEVRFTFPDQNGIYDAFRFVVNGVDLASSLRPRDGMLVTQVPISVDDSVSVDLGYRSRGMDTWRFEPSNDVASLQDFALVMTTDFDAIDFPPFAMSPSSRERTEQGWQLTWRFSQVVTGHDIGMVMPQRLHPGPLAAKLAFSAPISLFFFVLVLEALAALRKIAIHPLNHAFLAAAFFAFHLLFGYSADHLAIKWAFVLASVVSVGLVVSYLRLVVSPRFAVLEAGLAQLVYLVGFSLAHFWEGFTGITVTVLSIGTLFLLMQLTGRLDWYKVLSRPPASATPEASPA